MASGSDDLRWYDRNLAFRTDPNWVINQYRNRLITLLKSKGDTTMAALSSEQKQSIIKSLWDGLDSVDAQLRTLRINLRAAVTGAEPDPVALAAIKSDTDAKAVAKPAPKVAKPAPAPAPKLVPAPADDGLDEAPKAAEAKPVTLKDVTVAAKTWLEKGHGREDLRALLDANGVTGPVQTATPAQLEDLYLALTVE